MSDIKLYFFFFFQSGWDLISISTPPDDEELHLIACWRDKDGNFIKPRYLELQEEENLNKYPYRNRLWGLQNLRNADDWLLNDDGELFEDIYDFTTQE
jgi:hypothetical protein